MSINADCLSTLREQAFAMRAVWMQKMGFTEEEIAGECIDDGSPIDLKEEKERLFYANKLQSIDS